MYAVVKSWCQMSLLGLGVVNCPLENMARGDVPPQSQALEPPTFLLNEGVMGGGVANSEEGKGESLRRGNRTQMEQMVPVSG